MDDPVRPRQVKVSEFVAESLEEIASHSSASEKDSLIGAATSQRTVPTNKTVNVHGEKPVFFFKVTANDPGLYALKVKAGDLQTAKDIIAEVPGIISAEPTDEAGITNAMFDKLTEQIDVLRGRQSSTK